MPKEFWDFDENKNFTTVNIHGRNYKVLNIYNDYYTAGLILDYDGAYPFAVAAYNAGPKRVKYWKKINKDPQKKQVDFVDWVELIKFRETRNYVQRVLENYNAYRYILEKKPIPMKDFFKDRPLF